MFDGAKKTVSYDKLRAREWPPAGDLIRVPRGSGGSGLAGVLLRPQLRRLKILRHRTRVTSASAVWAGPRKFGGRRRSKSGASCAEALWAGREVEVEQRLPQHRREEAATWVSWGC